MNKPYPLERKLRIYEIQNLYNLADMAAKYEIMDSRAFSDFCGLETDTWLIHTLETTTGNVSYVSVTSKLLTGTEEEVNGDAGYVGANKRKDAITQNKFGKKIKYRIYRRPRP